MIYFTVGLPGRFAEWCDAVISYLAASRGGSVSIETWPSAADMLAFQPLVPVLNHVALSLIADNPDHLVMGIRQPNEQLRDALVETEAAFIVALDDPRLAAAEVFVDTEADPIAVTRAVANSCATLLQFATMPNALAVHADQARRDPAGTVGAIAQRFGIAIGAADAAGIVASVAEDDPALALQAPAEWTLDIPANAHRAVDGALGAYSRNFTGSGALGQITWTRDLFIRMDEPDKRPTEPIDATGNARILIYGPYLHLPAGSWNARVTLGFSPETARSSFWIDACYAGRQIACATIQPDAGGIYTTDLFFSLEGHSGLGLELRVAVGSDNVRGQLALGIVTLQPLSMRHFDNSGGEDYSSVLEL
ncbi:MAG TPA: hypothetical protein VHW90_02810 [Stellaceae bacterium]|jgi:hypothetical protein|nr:hypothetical protein [Stellaceae bacterium]